MKNNCGKYKPYPAYKPSGVEWLGEIPEHWEVRKLKLCSRCNSGTLPENTNPNYEIEYLDIGNVDSEGNILATENYYFADAPSRARRIPKSTDTIISTVRTYLKAIVYLENIPKNFIVVVGIEKGSKQLSQEVEAGTKIIVATLQKFPFIEDEIKNLSGKRFAIILDEAYSSSSGEMPKSMKRVLNLNREDAIEKEISRRGRQKNISYFAFTATPKPKTLGLSYKIGSPGRIRTYNQPVNSRLLYH